MRSNRHTHEYVQNRVDFNVARLDVNESLFRIFQRLDVDKDGKILRHELKRTLMRGGCINEQLLEQKLQTMDLDNDGKVDYKGNFFLSSFEY